MTAMSESFVDLTYRGLALGRRVKLTQVRPTTGYLELPTPMPVGTSIGLATDDGVLAAAMVTEIHEQVGGSEYTPGMLIKPVLDSEPLRAWWSARVALPEIAVPPPIPAVAMVRPKRSSSGAVPELVDDGRNTAAMTAVEPPPETEARDTQQIEVMADADVVPIVDDGKRTIAMAAVDLEALGLDPAASASGNIPVMSDDDDEPSSPTDTKPGGTVQRRKRKRR
jgi:hypothetical protein